MFWYDVSFAPILALYNHVPKTVAVVHTSLEQLRAAMAEFTEFSNQRRYHDGIGDVRSANVNYGRREKILQRREEEKRQTLYEQFQWRSGFWKDTE
jgi:hypothetical protein